MSAHVQPKVSVEAYLEADHAADFRSEYYAGYVYAMSGGTMPHAIIIANTARELGNALKKSPCFVTSSDMRLEVLPRELYTYPDVMVICGEARLMPERTDVVTNPTLIIEVLLPSTERYDRGFKSQQYRTMQSLQEYVFVSQSGPRVEIFRRRSRDEWLLKESIGIESSCTFESVSATIPLAEIYDRITFEAVAGPPRE